MDNLLLEIGGKELYLDIDRLSEIVRIEQEPLPLTVNEGQGNVEIEELPLDTGSLHIDVTKYEMYREMIGALMMYNEEVDNKMGKLHSTVQQYLLRLPLTLY